MQRRHFAAMAEHIKFLTDRTFARRMAEEMIDFFKTQNGQFKPERFLTACGF